MATCPRCGSSNIKFHRERSGATYSRKYKRTGIKSSWILPAGMSSGSRDYNYSTVGICNNCGYTFNTASGGGSRIGIGSIILVVVIIALLSEVFGGKAKKDTETTSSSTNLPAPTSQVVDSWVTPILSDYTYKFENQGIYISAYNGTGSSLIIPASYMVEGQSVPVLSVDLLFKRDRTINNLIFSEGITHIDVDIWGNSLQSVYLPSSIDQIPSFIYKDGGKGTLFFGGNEEQWRSMFPSTFTRSMLKFSLFMLNATADDCMNTINKPLKIMASSPDGYEALESFEYDVRDGHLILGRYRGENTTIIVSPSYVVDNTSYPVTELYMTFYGTKANLVVLPESVVSADNEVFNTARIKTIYIPASITDVTELFFMMMYEVDSVYYGGSEEQWKAVCPVDRFDLHILHIYYNTTPEDIATE